jgi:hypothetical protein
MKNKKILFSNMGVILAMGSIWGLSEVIMGMWLHKCAHLFSGAVMTGLAFFYMAFAWTLTRNVLSVVILLLTACIFKTLDALLLGVPIISGTVANPMFGFSTEILAFIIVIFFIGKRFREKLFSRSITGAGSALAAVVMFPLAGVFTGIPACVYPSTQVPLSIATSPVAIIISMITVPLGFELASRYSKAYEPAENKKLRHVLRYGLSPMVILLCLAILAMHRSL